MEDKKRILMLVNSIAGGGAEGVFLKQSEYFKSKGFEVFLGEVQAGEQKDTERLSFRFRSLFDFKAAISLIRFIKEKNISIVYATLDWAIFSARLAAVFCPSVKVIVRESGMADRKSVLMKLSDIVFNFRSDSIIAVSEEVKKSLLEYQLFHKGKIVVIGNGAISKFSYEHIDRIKKDKKLSRDPFIILSVGSMKNDNKGQGGMIRILKKLVETYPETEWKLVLAGDGKLRHSYESLAESLEIRGRVEFKGFIKGEKLADCYLEADVFLLNSKNEGCPNAAIESLAFGVPVIGTNVGGMSKIVIENETGFLVRRDDEEDVSRKIYLLASDREKLLDMSKKAYDHAMSALSFEKQADKVIAIFNEK